jgi:hypothetical protein
VGSPAGKLTACDWDASAKAVPGGGGEGPRSPPALRRLRDPRSRRCHPPRELRWRGSWILNGCSGVGTSKLPARTWVSPARHSPVYQFCHRLTEQRQTDCQISFIVEYSHLTRFQRRRHVVYWEDHRPTRLNASHGVRGARVEAERPLEELDPREQLLLHGEGEQVGTAVQVGDAQRAATGETRRRRQRRSTRGRSDSGTPASCVRNRSAAATVAAGTGKSSGHIPAARQRSAGGTLAARTD